MKTPRFIQAAAPVLNGAGQVMFQQSAWTGILFLIGIFWGAYECHTPAVAWGAVVGLVASYIAGVLLEPDGKGGAAGLWGFNGILVGCAFPTFLSDTPLMWAALIFCAMLSTWVRTGLNNLMAPFKINSLTFPFVLLTWIFLLSSRILDGIAPASLSTPELTGHFSTELSTSFGDLVVYWLKGISQVFLINSGVTGILFLVGLALCSRWAAAWAAIGSAISLALAILFKADGADIASGLFGFSPVLTGIAIGCTFYQPNVKSAVWAVVAIIATFFIQAAMDVFMMPFGLPTLTGPFCITTWLFLLPLYKFKKNVDTHTEWDSAWDGFVANLRDDEADKK
ncbi:MAG: urea transporter [Muribaculaceae bacterium]|nr:urea transporter [Muribaculaceae bacterium]